MPTMKEVCNMGLGKIGASRVNNLQPPVSTLEVKCAAEYQQWKSSELRKRRWVFATTLISLSSITTITSPPDDRTYKFQKPGDLLRAIRPKNCTWVQRGEFFYDFTSPISLEYIRDVPDNEMTDPQFIDVLAARVAVECAELASQSPGKKRESLILLKDALEDAGRLNAFVIDPHQTEGDEWAYTWDNARTSPEFSGM